MACVGPPRAIQDICCARHDRKNTLAFTTDNAIADAGIEKDRIDGVLVKMANSEPSFLYGQKVAEARLPDPVVVYSDDELVVVDKPARLITAPTPESDRMNLSDLMRQRLGGAIFDAPLSYRPAFQAALAFNLLNLMLLGILYFAQRRRLPIRSAIPSP